MPGCWFGNGVENIDCVTVPRHGNGTLFTQGIGQLPLEAPRGYSLVSPVFKHNRDGRFLQGTGDMKYCVFRGIVISDSDRS